MSTTYDDDLVALAKATAQVANYADHADHNEVVDGAWVLGPAETFRSVALRIALREGVDLIDAYAVRLHEIEARNVQEPFDAFDGPAEARAVSTWRDLQRVQAEHDRLYHPDVVGLHKSGQLQHYVLHLAKLVGAVAQQPTSGEHHADFIERRLPDLALFGIKLSTVMGQKLPSTPIASPGAAASATLLV